MRVRIEFCTGCGYGPKAVSLADTLLGEFQDRLSTIELVPGSQGVFEVTIGDDLVFSKKEKRRLPEDEEILTPLRDRT